MDDGQSARPPRTARPRPRLAQPRAWSGWLFPGSAVTSSPSMPGSITWRRTRSGFPACTACSAVSPSAASTTANHPPRGRRTARSGYAVRRRRRVPGACSPHRQVTAGSRSRRCGRPGALRRHRLMKSPGRSYGSRPGGRRPPRLKDRLHSSYQPSRGSRAMTAPSETERTALAARRQRLRDRFLAPPERRPPTAGRGIHHAALICSDPERTIGFYQELLGFPLVELVQNRDYPGSSHFFFDVGNSTLLGFFDFPGLGLGPAVEAIGGVQHIAVSVPPDRHAELRARLDDAGVPYAGPDRGIEESLYLRDPDGIQIELLRDELMLFGGRRLDAS